MAGAVSVSLDPPRSAPAERERSMIAGWIASTRAASPGKSQALEHHAGSSVITLPDERGTSPRPARCARRHRTHRSARQLPVHQWVRSCRGSAISERHGWAGAGRFRGRPLAWLSVIPVPRLKTIRGADDCLRRPESRSLVGDVEGPGRARPLRQRPRPVQGGSARRRYRRAAQPPRRTRTR